MSKIIQARDAELGMVVSVPSQNIGPGRVHLLVRSDQAGFCVLNLTDLISGDNLPLQPMDPGEDVVVHDQSEPGVAASI